MLECLKQNVHVRLKQLRPSFTFKENGRFTAFDNKDVIVLQSFIYIFVSGKKKKKIMQDSFFKPGLKFFYKVLLMAEMSSVPRSLAIQPKVPCCVTKQGLAAQRAQKPILWHRLLSKKKLLLRGLLVRRQETRLKSVSQVLGSGPDLRSFSTNLPG